MPSMEWHMHSHETHEIHLVSAKMMWLVFGNAWAILWIALPVCRPVDALVSAFISAFCFYKAATVKSHSA